MYVATKNMYVATKNKQQQRRPNLYFDKMTSSYLKDHVAVTDDAHKGISGNGESSGILTGVLHGGGGLGQVFEFIGRARSVLELLGGCSHKTNPVPLTPSESSVALFLQNTYRIKKNSSLNS